MNINQLHWLEDGLGKVALALSEMYNDSVLPRDVLSAISHLIDAEDYDKIMKYLGEN
jgi:hypothetical protein